MNALSRWEEAQKTLGSITTSLQYIEKKLENDEKFKQEIREKNSDLEKTIAVTNQILGSLSKDLSIFRDNQTRCKDDCEDRIREIQATTNLNKIQIERTRAIFKWSMGIASIVVPGLIGVAQVIVKANPKQAIMKPQEQITRQIDSKNKP